MNCFMTNLRALTKKKFLLQIRDSRTLVIELVFPIIFIFAGLALSNIKFLKDGHPRVLSPTQFPQPNLLYYNNPVIEGAGKSEDFVNNYFTRNPKEWKQPFNSIAVVPAKGEYKD